MTRPNIHVLVYADPGTGKSTFAATFPKPMLVWCFDSVGKDMPYWKGAQQIGDVQEYVVPGSQVIIPYRDVQHADGVIRIEYYHETGPTQSDGKLYPIAYDNYLIRMGYFHNEYQQWPTVVLDSTTTFELAARNKAKIMNPMTPFEKGTDTRQWFAASTEALEEMVVTRFGGLPMNTLCICHQSQQMAELTGEVVRGPAVPGRLLSRHEMAGSYQEIYRMYTMRQQDGSIVPQLQTKNRDGFMSTSLLGAPDPCYPVYESLWAGWV